MTNEPLLRIARPEAPLTDKVVSAVSEAMTNGALMPGQRLTERQLIDWTGVSRTSIREAVRQLVTQGLVERTSNGGMRIASLSRPVIEHIYEARSAIETAAVRLFIVKATDEEVAELAALGRRYGLDAPVQRVASDGDGTTRAYDDILVAGAHNPILTEMLAPLQTRIHQLRRLSMSNAGRADASRAEIREIIAAVLARDTERAAAASRNHVASAAKAALEASEHVSGDAALRPASA